ncbi:MAG: hypothetical protein JW969_04765 [Spirochaetales bacterium]|nr:hypothetical protein [Spirochaetales bacterium]
MKVIKNRKTAVWKYMVVCLCLICIVSVSAGARRRTTSTSTPTPPATTQTSTPTPPATSQTNTPTQPATQTNTPTPTTNSGGGTVTFYMTNANGSAKFAQQSSLSWSTASNSNPTITLNTGTSYQSIDGFGFTLTEGSAEVIQNCSQKSTLLNDLFSTGGIGISVLRISIGASDLSSSCYSYDETSGDTALNNFSLSGPDLTYLVPVLKSILAVNSGIKILAVPWSAPRWMKTNNDWVGGSLNTSYYSTYANYFKKYLDAMKAQGINIWAICPQNEPLNGNNMPSMTMSADQQTTFINSYLGPTLRNAGYSTKIICYDHNCDNTSYPVTVSNGASAYVDGAAFHLYAGSISALSTYRNSTGKNVYFTEQYTDSNGSFSGDFPWHMQNVMLGSVNNWARVALEWNLAANSSCGPHTSGGCSVCLPGVTVSSSSYSKNVAYYIVAHMSKFIRPGAVRVNTTTTDSGLLNAAFINGSTATVVVYNNSGGSRTFNISYGGSRVTATLAANCAGTFTWTTSGTSVATSTPTPSTAASATSTPTPASGGSTSGTIALRSRANNLYVCAEDGGASSLIARSSSVGTWELFNLVTNSDGTISLQSQANNLYVCAEDGGASALIARSSSIGTWEKFTIYTNADGTIALLSMANNLYVCAEDAGASPLIARSSSVSGWESFDMISQ